MCQVTRGWGTNVKVGETNATYLGYLGQSEVFFWYLVPCMATYVDCITSVSLA